MNDLNLNLRDGTEDPDALDAVTLRLVVDAAALLRAAEPDDEAAIERTIERVRGEAGVVQLLRALGGSFQRVSGAAPDLFGPSDTPDIG